MLFDKTNGRNVHVTSSQSSCVITVLHRTNQWSYTLCVCDVHTTWTRRVAVDDGLEQVYSWFNCMRIVVHKVKVAYVNLNNVHAASTVVLVLQY